MKATDHGHYPTDGEDEFPQIRRGRLQQLTIYEVTESELWILEHGSQDSVFLNFSVSLVSIAVSLSATLLTAHFPSDRLWTLFVVVTVVGYVVGIVLLCLWWKSRLSVRECAENIRRRLLTEEDLPDEII